MLVFIGIISLTQAASAKTYSIPPIPDYADSLWEPGTSVTYTTVVTHGNDTFDFKFRVAILDTEMDGETPLYWVEFDIFDITGLPSDLGGMMTEYYGEAPYSIRMMMLMPKYDLVTIATDPTQCYFDFTDPGFMRSMYFQYNRYVPYDVDTSLIGGFILPVIVSDLMGDDLPEDFLTENNLGIVMEENPDDFISENIESETAVEAGTIEGYMFDYTSNAVNGGTGAVFHTDVTPVLPIVMMAINWMSNVGPGVLNVELVELEESGATTQIVGIDQAIRFDLQTLMYGS